MDGGKERGTEGGTGGRADAGGMAANKTRTPHRDVGNNSPKGLGLLNSFLKICPPALYGCVRLCLATLYICLPALGCCGRLCLAQSFVQALVSMLKNTNCLGSTVV